MNCPQCQYTLDTALPKEAPCPECGGTQRSYEPIMQLHRRRWTQLICWLVAVPLLWVLAVFAAAMIVRTLLGRYPTRAEASLPSWYNSLLTMLDAVFPFALGLAAVTPVVAIAGLFYIFLKTPKRQRMRLGEFFHARCICMVAAWLTTNTIAIVLLRADPFRLRGWWWD